MAEFLYDGPKIEFTPRCIILKSDPSLENYLAEHRNGFQSVDVSDLGITIVHTSSPQPHAGSEAEYFEETFDGQFCGVIGRGRYTSAHSHKENDNPELSISEKYQVIGKLAVYQKGSGWKMVSGTFEEPGELDIPAGVPHFGHAVDKSAITMITMRNAERYSRDEWHIPVPNQQAFKNSAMLEFFTSSPEDRKIQ